MMDKTLLQVEDLRTHFFTRRGIVKAVDGVTFSLGRGESLGIVGESGCGKTMTSLSILRLLPEPAGRIVGGRIIFDGDDLLLKSQAAMRTIRGRKISIILQDPMTSLNPALTVGEQIAEVIRLHQKVERRSVREKVIEALKLVKISSPEARLSNFPHQMSGGMRQRVSGAVALSCRPLLLIADEPTTSLDVTIQAQYLRLLKEIQQESHMAMIFITHDFGIVARMCDRVAVMYAGRIVETTHTRNLFNYPRHPYTIALLHCLPRLQGEQQDLAGIEGQPPDLAHLPAGCRFAPRCRRKKRICEQEYPKEINVGDNHYVNCWLF